ncbi:transposable element Tcb2 transposase [Trichonephila clavipes]|nr:transposable element Tcb2 transposase [Trichonephila clavipes]
MVVNGRTASSRQLTAHWSTATVVLMLASSIRQRLLHRGYDHDNVMPVNAAFQSIPGAIFQQDNARPRVAKTVRDFCSVQHMQLIPWPVFSSNMLPIGHAWDLFGRRLARDPRPADSKDELLLRIQAKWNSLPQIDIQNLFDSMPRRTAARGGYTKY